MIFVFGPEKQVARPEKEDYLNYFRIKFATKVKRLIYLNS